MFLSVHLQIVSGILGQSNGHISNADWPDSEDHAQQMSKPSAVNGKKDYIIFPEDSTSSRTDFHFNTLRAIDVPHALQHGDFGETSTDQTLSHSDRMTETTLTMDPNCNTFKGSKKNRNGSDSGVEISPTLTTKVSDTMKSKPGVGYMTYDNSCICDDDEIEADRKSAADSQSVHTMDSTEVDLKGWHDWVKTELTSAKNPEDDLVSAKNAHLFFPPPTPEQSLKHNSDIMIDEDTPSLSGCPGVSVDSTPDGSLNVRDKKTDNAITGSAPYLRRLPENTAKTNSMAKTPYTYDNKAMVGSTSYVNKLPTQKPVAQIEPIMQQRSPQSRRSETVANIAPGSIPESKSPSVTSLQKVEMVTPPPEFSDEHQDDVFIAPSDTAVHIQPVRSGLMQASIPQDQTGIEPKRVSVKDLRAQFEKPITPDDHQSTLRKYGSKQRSASIQQVAPGMATLPRGKSQTSKTHPGSAQVLGKQHPNGEVLTPNGRHTPRSAPPGEKSSFSWAENKIYEPSA